MAEHRMNESIEHHNMHANCLLYKTCKRIVVCVRVGVSEKLCDLTAAQGDLKHFFDAILYSTQIEQSGY